MADIRIAIKDEAGIVRRVTKIVQMKDGIAASVPYHSAKEGWLYKFTPEYDKPHFTAPLSEMVHYTASDRVKLSIHLNGFVQFSSGGKKPILSGYDPTTEQPKGIGLQWQRVFAPAVWLCHEFECLPPSVPSRPGSDSLLPSC